MQISRRTCLAVSGRSSVDLCSKNWSLVAYRLVSKFEKNKQQKTNKQTKKATAGCWRWGGSVCDCGLGKSVGGVDGSLVEPIALVEHHWNGDVVSSTRNEIKLNCWHSRWHTIYREFHNEAKERHTHTCARYIVICGGGGFSSPTHYTTGVEQFLTHSTTADVWCRRVTDYTRLHICVYVE